MDTEHVSPRYCDIDLWNPDEILDALVESQFAAVAAVRAARPNLERAAVAMEARSLPPPPTRETAAAYDCGQCSWNG